MTPLLQFSDFGLRLENGGQLQLTRSLSLTVERGEIVGLVGESGSGKSLTARSAIRLLPIQCSASGQALFEGKDIYGMSDGELRALRRRGAAMIFQNPREALDPVRTIGHFLTETLQRHDNLPKSAAWTRAAAALADVGISQPERRLKQYPHEFSGGMLQRVMISAALLSGAQLLLADEPTTALDVTTQAEVVALLDKVRRERGVGIMFITHDLELAKAICGRIYVMYAGRILEEVPACRFDEEAMHPYTQALLAARPSLAERVERLQSIPGAPASAADVRTGCAFAPRCSYAQAKCAKIEPGLTPVAAGHSVRCVRAENLGDGGEVRR